MLTDIIFSTSQKTHYVVPLLWAPPDTHTPRVSEWDLPTYTGYLYLFLSFALFWLVWMYQVFMFYGTSFRKSIAVFTTQALVNSCQWLRLVAHLEELITAFILLICNIIQVCTFESCDTNTLKIEINRGYADALRANLPPYVDKVTLWDLVS